MTLAPLTTFSPLRIRSVETPPKLERPLTPGREMTREERKVARRRDGGGLDTAYVAKRMTFKLPSFIDQNRPPVKLPVSCDIINPSLVSLKQAEPSLGNFRKRDSLSLTRKSKGRLSNEALAQGWGIESSRMRASSQGTRQLTRPSLEADTTGSSKKRGLPEPTYDDGAVSSTAPVVPVKAHPVTADKSLKKGNKSKKALPARVSLEQQVSQSAQSADTDIISRKDQQSRALSSHPVGSTGLKATSATVPQSPTSNLSTSSETHKRDITQSSKDPSVPLREETNRKKRKVNRPIHDETRLSDTTQNVASSSTDHSEPKARKDESRTNSIHSDLQPSRITNAKSHNPSSGTSRAPTLTKKGERPDSIKIPNPPKRAIAANQTNMPWKPLDSVESPITPAYAKAFPSLTSTLQRATTSPADPIANRRLSTQLSDITNTIHSARPSGTLLTSTQSLKHPKNEVVRLSKTVKKGKARLDPTVESLEQVDSLRVSDGGKRPEEGHQQFSSSDVPQIAERASAKPQASIDDGISVHLQASQKTGSIVNKDVLETSRPQRKSTSLPRVHEQQAIYDPSPKWSALDPEVPQSKKLKKLAHKVFTPAKSSIPPIANPMQSNQVKNTCHEDELYVVADRFIKNQLNPPDIVWISIRKLLQDEIDNLQKKYLEEVYDRFKVQMMEYSEELIKHGLLKLRLQKLRKKSNQDQDQIKDQTSVRRTNLLLTSGSKNKDLDEKSRNVQQHKNEKKKTDLVLGDDVERIQNSLTESSKLNKIRRPNKNKNRGKSKSKTKVK
ncbi:hypothetical protein DFH28DRAFT_977762 [Melampsora americana]|nr:hypothetical protein DFH28DRAFT_977762 [Melampsora americana]